MTEHELLMRHAESWAASKKRPFDRDAVETVLDLRHRYDAAAATQWPAGSVERALLTLWPAYGPADVPSADELTSAFDTWFRFLRATGRLASGSAQPAELAKEARRAARKMDEAVADRARHSPSRVLADYGREIGIELEGAADLDDLQGRLTRIQDAWNALPVEERRRRMPDPSSKGLVGQAMNRSLQAMLAEADGWPPSSDQPWPPSPDQPWTPSADEPWPAWEYEPGDEEDTEWRPADEEVAAQEVREAPFVRQCLALAEWVGEGREVTGTGVLRPAVAREAYAALDLWSWERTAPVRYKPVTPDTPPEVERALAESALHSWSSAGDCLALDRLWYSCEGAGLITVGSRRAVRTDPVPGTDHASLMLGLSLVMGQCLRLGRDDVEPLIGTLLVPGVADEESVPLDAVRSWWDSRWAGGRGLGALNDELVKEIWRDKLDFVLGMFDDCGLWRRDDTTIAITEFGRAFTVVLGNALDEDGVLSQAY